MLVLYKILMDVTYAPDAIAALVAVVGAINVYEKMAQEESQTTKWRIIAIIAICIWLVTLSELFKRI